MTTSYVPTLALVLERLKNGELIEVTSDGGRRVFGYNLAARELYYEEFYERFPTRVPCSEEKLAAWIAIAPQEFVPTGMELPPPPPRPPPPAGTLERVIARMKQGKEFMTGYGRAHSLYGWDRENQCLYHDEVQDTCPTRYSLTEDELAGVIERNWEDFS